MALTSPFLLVAGLGDRTEEGAIVPRLYTYNEAAEWLNVSPGWLKKMVAANEVPYRKLGDLTRFSESDLEAIANRAAFTPAKTRARGRR
jgi:excisionase family DNA binding protein